MDVVELRSHVPLRCVALALSALFVTGACASSGSAGKADAVGSELSAAIQLQNQGHLDQAKALYEQVLAKAPQNYAALYDLGVIAQTQGDTTGALSRYAAALVIKPDFVSAMFNEATIYAKDQPQLAMSLYRQIIKLQPVAPTAYLNLGFLELSAGSLKAAVRDFAEAEKQEPDLSARVPKRLQGAVHTQARHLPSASPQPSTAAPSAAASPTS
ncbi:MAG: tetratricopeptide repeat protein [Mycobacteriales bacterium]